ncbi:hypothetical protein V6N13_026654 [Hibiscus sabdariffa]
MLDLAINITLDQNPRVAATLLLDKKLTDFSLFRKGVSDFCSLVYSGGLRRDLFVNSWRLKIQESSWDFNFIIPLRLVFAYHVPTMVCEVIERRWIIQESSSGGLARIRDLKIVFHNSSLAQNHQVGGVACDAISKELLTRNNRYPKRLAKADLGEW